MKELSLNQLEIIGGSNDTVSAFCAGFGAVAVAYEIGVLANWWNPVGWTAGAIGVAIGAGCAINELT